MKQIKFISVILILFFLASCNGCNKTKSRPKPDVSAIQLKIEVQRFDKDLMDFTSKDFETQQAFMQSRYGAFYNFYVSQFVIGPRRVGDTTDVREAAIKKYVTDAYIRRIQDSINVRFADTKDLNAQLTESFKYFKYYFPKVTTPQVVSINSGFSMGAFTYDKDLLGIGLDLYLGPHNLDYDSAGVYEYLQHKMRREYIPRNAMEVMYNLYFGDEQQSDGKNLVEAIVDKGKKMYFLAMMLPDAPDSLLLGYTEKQTLWCQSNEYEIWKFMNDKDLLYKNNSMDHKRYLDEGPTTPGMPPESPGNIGGWIGLQVVRKFMDSAGDKISLADLVLKYDSKTILERAKYRPSKQAF